jgi:maltose O-acetyltransferase
MDAMQTENQAVAEAKGGTRRSPLARLIRALKNDLEGLHPRLRLVNCILFFCPHYTMNRLRTALYRRMGVRIGPRALILGTLDMSGTARIWERLRIGEEARINVPLTLDLNADITIGNHVTIGHDVKLVTTNHETGQPHHRCGPSFFAPIVIEEGCWVGAGAMILPGVTIGRGSVVGAGAVVAADVPPNMTVWGNPARPVKALPTE